MTAKQTNKITPKARGGKKLMSELLTDTRKYIEQAEHADVESLRQFLLTDPERPLIAMGHTWWCPLLGFVCSTSLRNQL